MDLTAARLFCQSKENQCNLVRILERWYGHKTIGFVSGGCQMLRMGDVLSIEN